MAVTTTEEKKTVTDAVGNQTQAAADKNSLSPGFTITGNATAPTTQQTTPVTQQTTQQTTPETPATPSGTEAPAGSTGGVGTAQVTGQTQGTTAGSTTGTTTTTKVTYTPPEFKEAEYAPDLKPILDDWLTAAREQQEKSIDYATNQGVAELQRAQEDAKQAYQTQRNQVATAEQRALDNQALYAESRGDKGGIGAAQYAAIQNTAAINTLAVNQQQTKLATDTARQIADLRAQGEYKKADALLTLTQNYLSQLLSLKQWALSFNLSVDEFNNSLKQWALSYEMEVAQLTGTYQGEPTYAAQQDQLDRLSQSGYALLQAGVLPSQEQLDAMGMTQQEAYYWMQANGFTKMYGLEGTPFETVTRYPTFSGGGSSSGGSSSGSSSSSKKSSSGTGSSKYRQNSTMTTEEIKAIQKSLGVTADGIWGPNTDAAYQKSLSPISSNKSTQYTGTSPNTSKTSFSYSPDEGIYTYAGKSYNSMDAVKNAINNANLSDAEFAAVKRKAESQTGVKWK